MKPKNSKERRNSFLKFLLIFVVTVGTIVTAVFFNFQIVDKENQVLKEQALKIRAEHQFQDQFIDDMEEVSVIIDSITAPGATVAFDNATIGQKLAELKNSIPETDSTHNYLLYENIVMTYVKLQKSQNRLLDVSEKEQQIKDFETELEKCDQNVIRLNRELQIASRQ